VLVGWLEGVGRRGEGGASAARPEACLLLPRLCSLARAQGMTIIPMTLEVGDYVLSSGPEGGGGPGPAWGGGGGVEAGPVQCAQRLVLCCAASLVRRA